MIVIGSDHSGVEIKKEIINYLRKKGIIINDVNSNYSKDDDYPDIACNVAKNVLENKDNLGIAICGTGIGISIACNKIKGIRAALCMDEYTAEMSKRHNNANILCLGARTSVCDDLKTVYNIIDIFLNTSYEGGRHERRLQKIKMIEEGKNLEGEI